MATSDALAGPWFISRVCATATSRSGSTRAASRLSLDDVRTFLAGPLSDFQLPKNPFSSYPFALEGGSFMFDPATLLLGTTAASLVAAFLSKSAEEIGKKTIDAAWHKTSTLVEFLKTKMGGPQDALTLLQLNPGNKAAEDQLATAINEHATRDASFARELTEKLEAASDAGADMIFNTHIAGPVKNLTNIGRVKILNIS
jgi:hypothetical protein